jgi:hypothetical protein
MSGPAASVGEEGWDWLPQRLRPATLDSTGGVPGGRRWRAETIVLVLVGLLLAIATVNDVVRQRGVNERLIADLRTWRVYTGHDYRNISADQELLGSASHKEVVCGNTSPGAPKARPQICLVVWGPVVHGVRTVHGGWYLPAKVQDDVRPERYGCFGAAGSGACPR